VLHDTAPATHAPPGFVAQAAPAEQATHAPLPLHTPPLQPVPAPRALPSTQTGPPEAHDVTPVMHAAPGLPLQAAPGVHATHAPLPLHTPPLHATPAAFAAPFTQVGVPVEQLIVPLEHDEGLPVQALPCTHAVHPPLWHTPAPPPLATQVVPFVFGASSTQARPVAEHCSLPVRHAGLGLSVQGAPATH
jgi:hypothetical protein